ncbi:hypothetical protein CSC37_4855 [Escherichia coli]|nr:hypothetical protein CSC37_4855 [Escherichia coli]
MRMFGTLAKMKPEGHDKRHAKPGVHKEVCVVPLSTLTCCEPKSPATARR